MDITTIDCATGAASTQPMDAGQSRACQQTQQDVSAWLQTRADAVAATKQAAIDDLIAAYRPMAASPATRAAAGYMLKMALVATASTGVTVVPADLPPDLQAVLTRLPSAR